LAEASYNGQPDCPAARLITGRLFLPEISDGCDFLPRSSFAVFIGTVWRGRLRKPLICWVV
jgi:hypothetical protein